MISKIFRLFPPFKGKQRLARMLLRKTLDTATDVRVDGQYGCRYKVPNVKETIGFELLINGIYEKDTVDFIAGLLKANQVFLDVGANIGAISIPVSKKRNDVRTISLEAAPWIFKILEENVTENKLSNITIINRAIADANDKKVPFFSPQEKFGKGSLAPVFTSEGVEVDTITLDALASQAGLAKVGFIKIDVEGFEWHAFAGGSSLLKASDAPDILFEFVDWAEDLAGLKPGAAQQSLLDYGYRIFVFEKNALGQEVTAPLTKGANMLFATKKRPG